MSNSESSNFNKERVERIATQIMAAIVQADESAYQNGSSDNPIRYINVTARDAVKFAKALIDEIDKEFEEIKNS